jgi:hypothetical protein
MAIMGCCATRDVMQEIMVVGESCEWPKFGEVDKDIARVFFVFV